MASTRFVIGEPKVSPRIGLQRSVAQAPPSVGFHRGEHAP